MNDVENETTEPVQEPSNDEVANGGKLSGSEPNNSEESITDDSRKTAEETWNDRKMAEREDRRQEYLSQVFSETAPFFSLKQVKDHFDWLWRNDLTHYIAGKRSVVLDEESYHAFKDHTDFTEQEPKTSEAMTTVFKDAWQRIHNNHEDFIAWQVLFWCCARVHMSRKFHYEYDTLSPDERGSRTYSGNFLGEDIDFEIPSDYDHLPAYLSDGVKIKITAAKEEYDRFCETRDQTEALIKPIETTAEAVRHVNFASSLEMDRLLFRMEDLLKPDSPRVADLLKNLIDRAHQLMSEAEQSIEQHKEEMRQKGIKEEEKTQSLEPILVLDPKMSIETAENIRIFALDVLKCTNDIESAIGLLEASRVGGKDKTVNALYQNMPDLKTEVLPTGRARDLFLFMEGAVAWLKHNQEAQRGQIETEEQGASEDTNSGDEGDIEDSLTRLRDKFSRPKH